MKTLSWYILVAARIFVQRFFSNENCTNKYAEPVGSLTWPYCKRHVRPQVCALTNAISHVYRQLRPVGPRATRRFMHDRKRDKSGLLNPGRSESEGRTTQNPILIKSLGHETSHSVCHPTTFPIRRIKELVCGEESSQRDATCQPQSHCFAVVISKMFPPSPSSEREESKGQRWTS